MNFESSESNSEKVPMLTLSVEFGFESGLLEGALSLLATMLKEDTAFSDSVMRNLSKSNMTREKIISIVEGMIKKVENEASRLGMMETMGSLSKENGLLPPFNLN